MKAIAEAPSKVIVTGEHFVVHGAWALAAAIGREVRVEVREAERFRVESERVRSSSSPALVPIEKVVESMAREFSFRPSLHVSVSSRIPDGAGLGSSASTMVALSSAISRLRGLGLGRKEIVEFAMVGEREIHGRPSGIDAAICAQGGVILYKVGLRPKQVPLSGTRHLLVIFSGKKRQTKKLISHVADVKSRLPHFFAGLADSASEVSAMAAERLQTGDTEGLGRLMTFNHAVLSAVGVSNEDLDGLVDLLLSLGCCGAKLTGAGGGGSLLAVAPEGKEKSIISELTGRGFDAFVAEIPVEGVKSWLER